MRSGSKPQPLPQGDNGSPVENRSMKGRPTMPTSSLTASTSSLPAHAGASEHSRQMEERVYQGFTIAAILLVLGSMWVF
jgi:hypothetical protein